MMMMVMTMIIIIFVISSISTHLKMMVMTREGIPEEEKLALRCHLGVVKTDSQVVLL